ncbi:putative lactate 2-monooxygenase [Fusarium oxysporum f. sp. rapae]|uniref:Putative lactate 2-monooxygenase n=1 Tax=Fusarium oxysporum f. sp. rapae TaxID=485398 RepID=A0A8J5NT68_FUSOX|nr:putative lactate 2-monooxygenase [Fusarium oxysporum f. sp. rapae]
MSDPRSPHLKKRDSPPWGLYQRENFWKLNDGEVPPFNTHPDKLEEVAKKKLTENGWLYASSNAGLSDTHLANRQAFFRHKIVPRQLVAQDSEESYRIPEGPRFFQLYMPYDDELTLSLLKRAHEFGFSACILTTDTWQLGWRHDDVATSNYAFYRGIGADLGLSDPVFQKRLVEHGIDPKKKLAEASALWIDNVWHSRAWSWEKAVWAREKWQEISDRKPFLIKGIQRVDDAEKAADLGFEVIVVNNHAGRQVDGAIGSLMLWSRLLTKLAIISL